MYRVYISSAAQRFLEKIKRSDRRLQQRIGRKIDSLAENPRPSKAKPLRGLDYYSLREGRCRILYHIFDDYLIVLVVEIGDRAKIYKEILRKKVPIDDIIKSLGLEPPKRRRKR